MTDWKQKKQKPEELLNPKDFESIDLSIKIENLTTKTPARGSDDLKTRNRIVEFFDKGFLLDIPKGVCAQGHQLQVSIVAKGGSIDIAMKATAKVGKCEESEKDRLMIEIELLQFDMITWRKLQHAFGSRQNEIEEFFKAVKGH